MMCCDVIGMAVALAVAYMILKYNTGGDAVLLLIVTCYTVIHANNVYGGKTQEESFAPLAVAMTCD